jgi:glycosyltransferase involved in cell wall biosynthesis
MVVFNDYTLDPRVRREAEALIERGHTVDCVCLCRERITQLRGVRLFYPSRKRYRGSNLFWLLLGYVRFFGYALFKVTIRHLREPYDVLQVHTMPDFLIFTAVIPKLLGAKVVLDMHDLMPEVYVAKYGSRHWKWMVPVLRWIERASVAFADRAIAVHKPHLDIIVEHGNPREKFSIVLNAPDHRIFVRQARPRARGREFRLIYHGTTPRRAGLDIAIRAVERARRHIPNLRLQIVGRSESLKSILALVNELELADCVQFSPCVPVEELPGIIGQADVGIVPYTADVFTQYVLPTKLLEYAALGIPAIVSRLRTVEAYFDARMVAYVEPGNVDELAEKIVLLYRNPDIAARLSAHAARFADSHTWRQQRETYYKLMDSLLPARPVLAKAKG